jgi:hypothetical protein
MADIVQGMFGINPSQLGQERYNTGYAQDLRAVQLDPMQQANLALRQGGRGIAQGAIAPMLGVQDPELQKAQMAQQLASQFDITSPAGLTQYAQALAQNGMPEFAQIAATKAQDMESKGLGIQQSQLNIQKTQQSIDKTKFDAETEAEVRAKISAAGPQATEDEILAIVRPYGDVNTIIRALTASQDKQAALAQRQAALDVKAYDKAKTETEKVKVVTDNADRMINVIQESIPMVGYNTAGLAGKATIWGSEGADLQKNLDTVKANLGFDRLQQMRDASKTGGALGSVAVKELEALQSTVSSLDRTQSPDALRDSLKDIEYYYSRWRKAVNGEDPGPAVRAKKGQTPTGTTAPAQGKKTITLPSGVIVTVE